MKDIEESNKFIAEFMDIDIDSWKSCSDYAQEHHCFFNDEWYEGELFFHKSWDWLMPVINKIMSCKEPKEETDGWYAYHAISNNLELVDINLTFKQVVEFIKWYNNEQISR